MTRDDGKVQKHFVVGRTLPSAMRQRVLRDYPIRHGGTSFGINTSAANRAAASNVAITRTVRAPPIMTEFY
jgi:hypothetical protein